MKTGSYQKFFWRDFSSHDRDHAAGRRTRIKLWKWTAAVISCIAVAACWRFLPVGNWTQDFASSVDNKGAAGIGLFILAYAVGSVLFMPATVFTLAAGMAYGTFFGALVSGLGATLGAATTFLIARSCLRRHIDSWFAHSERRRAFDEALAHGGWKIVILFRLTPTMPFAFSNYLFGLTKIRFVPFLIATAIGIVPGSLLHTYLGHMGRVVFGEKRARTPIEYAFLALGLLATLVLTLYVQRLSKKQLEHLRRDKSERSNSRI